MIVSAGSDGTTVRQSDMTSAPCRQIFLPPTGIVRWCFRIQDCQYHAEQVNRRGFRRLIVGLVMTAALAGCSAASSSPSPNANASTSTTAPASTATTAAPQTAPIGTAIHLVDHTVIGGNQLVQTATVRLVGIIDPATPAQPVPSSVSTIAGGGRWVAMRLEATNDGPSSFGNEESPRSWTLEFQTDRKTSPNGAAFPLNMVDCPALNYPLLEPDTTTMGCVSIEIPPGSVLRTLDVALALSGGGDTRPIAEWTLS
jgi:hypothetical protein